MFGISVVVTSHLMAELERVSGHIVVIDGGKLLRSAATADVTAVTQRLVIEVSERPQELLARLTASGLSVALSGHQVMTVEIADNTTYDVVRDAVAELGVPLIRLQQARHHMVDIFRDDNDIRQQESA